MIDNCIYCNKEFIKDRKDRVLCSLECAKKHKIKYNKDRYIRIRKLKPSINKKCIICGKVFETKKNIQITCGKECKIRHDNNSERHKLSKIRYENSKKGIATLKNYKNSEEYDITMRKSRKKWIKNNRTKYVEIQLRRRKRVIEMNITHSFSYDEWQNKLNNTKGICPGYKVEPHFVGIDNLTTDHNPPVSKAPKNFTYTIKDVQPLCIKCNSRKGNR
jgi:hypothetical protein